MNDSTRNNGTHRHRVVGVTTISRTCKKCGAYEKIVLPYELCHTCFTEMRVK